jgi:hypothetical protein
MSAITTATIVMCGHTLMPFIKTLLPNPGAALEIVFKQLDATTMPAEIPQI